MNIVITGSTKGIGLALAKKFLEYGDNVIITSRTKSKVDEVVKELQQTYPKCKVFGLACDVTKAPDVKALAEYSKEKLGQLDIWINNAGVNTGIRDFLINIPDEKIKQVVDTNITGTLYGCKEALKIMIPQKSGHIFNFLGRGSEGASMPKSLVYCSTKRAIPLITKTLIKETKGTGVGIHDMSPGMVLTDLLLKGNNDLRTKRVFNILAEKPETVAKYLVPRARDVTGTGKKIVYLTSAKAFWRFMTARSRRNKFFDEKGDPV